MFALHVLLSNLVAVAPPNILFFLADDMGYGDAGYLATGNKHGKLLTPNLDAMVEQGMSFTEVRRFSRSTCRHPTLVMSSPHQSPHTLRLFPPHAEHVATICWACLPLVAVAIANVK
jgi:hypothetical protein